MADFMVPADSANDNNPLIVSTLICHRDIDMALACLASVARCSDRTLLFKFHDDGSLTREDVIKLSNNLPTHQFVARAESDEILCDLLAKHPSCASYRRKSPFGIKLFDVPLLASGNSFAYCDTDIFFFKPFKGLFTWPDNKTGCLFMRDCMSSYAVRPRHLLIRPWIKLPKALNAGLFYFRKKHYDLDYIEWLLARNENLFQTAFYFIEQTLWAALSLNANGRFWDRGQIRMIHKPEMFDSNVVGGHFVKLSRGYMSEVIKLGNEQTEAVRIRTEPMRQLYFPELFFMVSWSLLNRRFGRKT